MQAIRPGFPYARSREGAALQISPGGQNDRPHVKDGAGVQHQLPDGSVPDPQLHHLALAQLQPGLALQRALHIGLIAPPVRLSPQ